MAAHKVILLSDTLNITMLNDVVLHVYQLELEQGGSFVSRFLPSLGMGAFHTSLEVDGYRYTFASNAGIVKTEARNEGVPSGAVFKQSIPLGVCACNRAQLNAVIKQLGQVFHGTSYHLVHRNCNHFTETLGSAIVLYDRLVDMKQGRLKTFPEWINRLANTSKMVVSHDEDIIPCNVLAEARKAVGADQKVGWDLKQTKKTLTESQKAALAKIRGGSE
jgi:hypothetical protein